MKRSWLPTLSAPYLPQRHYGNRTVHGAERTSSVRIAHIRLLRPVLTHGRAGAMLQAWFLGTVSTDNLLALMARRVVIHSSPNIENELLRILLSQLRALIHFWKKIKRSHSDHCHVAIFKYKVCIMSCHVTYYYGNIPFLQKDQFLKNKWYTLAFCWGVFIDSTSPIKGWKGTLAFL